MTRIVLIARNTFRGIMSKRALYIWAFAVVLMFLRSAPAILSQTTDERMLLFQRANAVSGSLDMWSLMCLAAAIFLGAGAIAPDIASKTLVTVLARPVRRWELLAGRWLGLTAFCVLTLGLCIGLGTSLARYLGIEVDWSVLGIAATRTVAGIIVFSGFAIGLSSVATTAVAAALTVLLAFMPPLIQLLINHPERAQQRAGAVLKWVVPPGYTSHYLGTAWAPFPTPPNYRGPVRPQRRPPEIDYRVERRETALAAGYAVVYFLGAVALFSRRDIKIG